MSHGAHFRGSVATLAMRYDIGKSSRTFLLPQKLYWMVASYSESATMTVVVILRTDLIDLYMRLLAECLWF